MEQRFEVAIIGGGPAASVTAMLLSRSGISTIILEGADETTWKIGEGLPPSSLPIIQKLGLWDHFIQDLHLPSYGNCSSWGSDELVDHNFVFDPYGNGWHLDRRRFDAMLAVSAVESGATRLTGTRVVACYQISDSACRLELRSRDGSRSSTCARFIVDASGRSSWFAQHRGAKRINYDRLLGLAALLTPAVEFADEDSLTMVEAVEPGWWYSARIPGNKMVVAFLSDGDLQVVKDARTRFGWLRLLGGTNHIKSRIDRFGYQIELGPRAINANSSRLSAVVGESWVAVGDAAAAYDPLSSQGILMAMEMGQQAAVAVRQYLEGQGDKLEEYALRVEGLFARYLADRNYYYSQERRWRNSPFWQRRAGST